jgi:hypothetical protein
MDLKVQFTLKGHQAYVDSAVRQVDDLERRASEEAGEHIRHIEAKALRKLKHPSRSRKLRSFLDS